MIDQHYGFCCDVEGCGAEIEQVTPLPTERAVRPLAPDLPIGWRWLLGGPRDLLICPCHDVLVQPKPGPAPE
jgi:hypothetical protein